jgi:hypothetical protein
MPRIAPSQVRRFIASIPLIVLLTPLSSALAQQKPAPPPPHSQTQLEDRVKDLEAGLKVAEQKAASAALEKDYITRVQKQYETYYKEVLSTQTWTLGIFGLILTGLFAVAAKFSIDIFDSRTKSALDAALAKVEKRLSEQNSAQLKASEDGLTKRITDQENDLKTRSDYQFQFAQGLSFTANEIWNQASKHFRRALAIYKSSKPRQLFKKDDAVICARNIFVVIKSQDKAKFEANARKELADELYNDLEDELARVALTFNGLAPLLNERKTTVVALSSAARSEAEPAQTSGPPAASALTRPDN